MLALLNSQRVLFHRSLSSSSTRTMSTHSHLSDDCIFCKIIRGQIPSFKLVETDKSFAFMDIDPLSPGHSLVIPKYHAEFFHQVPDEYLADALPVAKKIAAASNLKQYNVLQNNGKLANQAVPHVHFHVIPKPNEEQGLGVRWKPIGMSKDEVQKVYDETMKNLQ
ncbi:hit family protein 1 [Lichtheimia corymbifera JMRC:FSU:9682]|uniref:Hit family protein 1 n=2 Tax=Lichtheimia TaxID=688353 RepID=A0A068SAN3_9FUNG|nr:uncharacterized protein O0I10_001088 [Lichtheimia ornata]KAJ8662912.1 hypothetical protein O0I10_001088 [Lichtheimia ornata]CDH58902.1 hit family protein 1 [Lichtheimia corymbifera JMRC:FSU:9682]